MPARDSRSEEEAGREMRDSIELLRHELIRLQGELPESRGEQRACDSHSDDDEHELYAELKSLGQMLRECRDEPRSRGIDDRQLGELHDEVRRLCRKLDRCGDSALPSESCGPKHVQSAPYPPYPPFPPFPPYPPFPPFPPFPPYAPCCPPPCGCPRCVGHEPHPDPPPDKRGPIKYVLGQPLCSSSSLSSSSSPGLEYYIVLAKQPDLSSSSSAYHPDLK